MQDIAKVKAGLLFALKHVTHQLQQVIKKGFAVIMKKITDAIMRRVGIVQCLLISLACTIGYLLILDYSKRFLALVLTPSALLNINHSWSMVNILVLVACWNCAHSIKPRLLRMVFRTVLLCVIYLACIRICIGLGLVKNISDSSVNQHILRTKKARINGH